MDANVRHLVAQILSASAWTISFPASSRIRTVGLSLAGVMKTRSWSVMIPAPVVLNATIGLSKKAGKFPYRYFALPIKDGVSNTLSCS